MKKLLLPLILLTSLVYSDDYVYNVNVKEMSSMKTEDNKNTVKTICINSTMYIIVEGNGTSVIPAITKSGKPAGCFIGYQNQNY